MNSRTLLEVPLYGGFTFEHRVAKETAELSVRLGTPAVPAFAHSPAKPFSVTNLDIKVRRKAGVTEISSLLHTKLTTLVCCVRLGTPAVPAFAHSPAEPSL